MTLNDNGSEVRAVILNDKGCEDKQLTAEFREFISKSGGSLGFELYPRAVCRVLTHVAKEHEAQEGSQFVVDIQIEVVTERELSEIPQEDIETEPCRLMVSAT